MQTLTEDFSTKDKLDMVLHLSCQLGLKLRDRENNRIEFYYDQEGDYYLLNEGRENV